MTYDMLSSVAQTMDGELNKIVGHTKTKTELQEILKILMLIQKDVCDMYEVGTKQISIEALLKLKNNNDTFRYLFYAIQNLDTARYFLEQTEETKYCLTLLSTAAYFLNLFLLTNFLDENHKPLQVFLLHNP